MATRTARGFSLLEVVIAIAIIAVAVVAASAVFQRVPVNGREVRDQDLALKIARNEVEMLRGSGYGALPASGPFSNPLLSSLRSGAGAVAVTDLNAKTKQVAVTVSWQGADSAGRSISLTTLVTQNSGLQ